MTILKGGRGGRGGVPGVNGGKGEPGQPGEIGVIGHDGVLQRIEVTDEDESLRLQLQAQCEELGRGVSDRRPEGVDFVLLMFRKRRDFFSAAWWSNLAESQQWQGLLRMLVGALEPGSQATVASGQGGGGSGQGPADPLQVARDGVSMATRYLLSVLGDDPRAPRVTELADELDRVLSERS